MQKSTSILSQVLKEIPRRQFGEIVDRHKGNAYSKGFTCWDQLVAMLFCQLSGQNSLRDLEFSFNAQATHHYHLGSRSLKRSTLADANLKRPAKIFHELLDVIIGNSHRQIRRDTEEFIRIIDSTPIPLKGRGFEWAKKNPRTTGLKTHIVFDPGERNPIHVSITPPTINDINEAQKLPIEPGGIYIFDKGYVDYGWWQFLHSQGCIFVSRLRNDAHWKVVQENKVSSAHILEDKIICLTTYHGKKLKTGLRRICVRLDTGSIISIVSNDLTSSAERIAELYKMRWQVELFFKWLKQNLKIKKFIGKTENAVKIQIFTALIAYVLLNIISRLIPHLSPRLCANLVKQTLFQHRKIAKILHPPPDLPKPKTRQLELLCA